MEKYCTAGRATDDNNIRRRRDERIHNRDIEYLPLLDGNNGYAKASECYIIDTVLVLFPV
jgi:hypothetical protein